MHVLVLNTCFLTPAEISLICKNLFIVCWINWAYFGLWCIRKFPWVDITSHQELSRFSLGKRWYDVCPELRHEETFSAWRLNQIDLASEVISTVIVLLFGISERRVKGQKVMCVSALSLYTPVKDVVAVALEDLISHPHTSRLNPARSSWWDRFHSQHQIRLFAHPVRPRAPILHSLTTHDSLSRDINLTPVLLFSLSFSIRRGSIIKMSARLLKRDKLWHLWLWQFIAWHKKHQSCSIRLASQNPASSLLLCISHQSVRQCLSDFLISTPPIVPLIQLKCSECSISQALQSDADLFFFLTFNPPGVQCV